MDVFPHEVDGFLQIRPRRQDGHFVPIASPFGHCMNPFGAKL